MLRARIIPCLLVHQGGLVKTQQFANPKYVGDPINAVRIFNEKQVDELMVIDIDATVEGREPDYELVEHLAAECRMPLCYGGGVKTKAQIEHIIGLGVEKVAVSSLAFEQPNVVAEASRSVGSQSIVTVMDVRKGKGGRYEAYTHNGQRRISESPVELAKRMQDCGAGELVVNSIDNDGIMKGYDRELIRQLKAAVTIPLTTLGGAASLDDMKDVIQEHGSIGVAAGSLFVFKGPYRAVLINYPAADVKQKMLANAM